MSARRDWWRDWWHDDPFQIIATAFGAALWLTVLLLVAARIAWGTA